MRKFVWDTSALLNIKEPNKVGYSPGHSLMKDLSDGWIPGPYRNIFPALSFFEWNASVSRLHREGRKTLRELYIGDDNAEIYPIDTQFIQASAEIVIADSFRQLRGADLVFACIAYLEEAYLVTLDRGFRCLSGKVEVIDLNESRDTPRYRSLFL